MCIIQSLIINPKVLILNTETKDKVNIYTLVNLDTNQTQTIVGVKKNIVLHKPIIATINIKISKEVLELKDGTKKYLNTASLFITDFEDKK